MIATSSLEWIVFFIVIAAALVVDLYVFHHKARLITVKRALVESLCWIALSLGFAVWIYWSHGRDAGTTFLTSYLVEKSLSIDNIFVFILIFRSAELNPSRQHKVLYYGVVGALAMRMLFIIAGIELLEKFHPVIFLFGAILIIAAVRMLRPAKRPDKRRVEPERNWLVRIVHRLVPFVDDREGDHFWIKRNGKWNATPLFLALLAVEAMDIVFAVDSVPAVLAITRDTFIAYSSNALALLGLRALYFVLADALGRLRFLHQGLAAILLFVGGKMLVSDWLPISASVSLIVIAIILAVTVLISLAAPPSRINRNSAAP